MLKRLALLSFPLVALTSVVAAQPAGAATCSATIVANIPGAPQQYIIYWPATIPASFVGTYQTNVNTIFAAFQAALPPGSSVVAVNVCS